MTRPKTYVELPQPEVLDQDATPKVNGMTLADIQAAKDKYNQNFKGLTPEEMEERQKLLAEISMRNTQFGLGSVQRGLEQSADFMDAFRDTRKAFMPQAEASRASADLLAGTATTGRGFDIKPIGDTPAKNAKARFEEKNPEAVEKEDPSFWEKAGEFVLRRTAAAPYFWYKDWKEGKAAEEAKDRLYSEDVIRSTFAALKDVPRNDKGEYLINGMAFTQDELYPILNQQVTQLLHPQLMQTSDRYRNDWAANLGYKDFNAYIDNALIKPLKGLDAQIANETAKSAYAEMERAPMASQEGAFVSTMVGAEAKGRKEIRDAIDALESIKAGDWSSGFAEGFDFLNFATLGVTGLGADAKKLHMLYKVNNGDTLTPEEQRLYDIYKITEEANTLREMVPQPFWNEAWSQIGHTAELAPQFIPVMGLASSVANLSKVGIKAGIGLTQRALRQGVVKGITTGLKQTGRVAGKVGLNVLKANLGGLVVTPLQASTYSTYLQKREEQFKMVNGELVYTPTAAWKDAVDTLIEQTNEISSEILGAGIADVVGLSFKSVGKMIGLDKVINGVSSKIGIGAAYDKIFGLKKSDVFRAFERRVGYAGDPFSEALSEIWGDFSANLMKMVITGNHNFSTFTDPRYWKTNLAVAAIYGTSLQVARGVGSIPTYAEIAQLGKMKHKAIRNIDRQDLKDALRMMGVDGTINDAAYRLANFFKTAQKAAERGEAQPISQSNMALAMDYIRAEAMQQMLIGVSEENNHMVRFTPVAARIAEYAYKGVEGNEDTGLIYEGTLEDGTKMTIVSGDVTTEATADNLLMVKDQEGNITPMARSKFKSFASYSVSNVTAAQFQNMFGAEQIRADIAEIEQIYKGLENPTKKDVMPLMQQMSIPIPEEGETVKMVDGRGGMFLGWNEDGTLNVEAQNAEGNHELLVVPFYELLSAQGNIAEAQQTALAEKTLSTAEEAIETEAPEMEAMPSEGVTPEQAQAEGAKAVEAAQNAVAEIASVPMTEDGAVDFDAITDPKIYAQQYVREVGSVEQAVEDITGMRAAVEEDIANKEAKGKKITSATALVASRKEVAALKERVAFYDAVLNELAPKEEVVETPKAEAETPTPETAAETATTEAPTFYEGDVVEYNGRKAEVIEDRGDGTYVIDYKMNDKATAAEQERDVVDGRSLTKAEADETVESDEVIVDNIHSRQLAQDHYNTFAKLAKRMGVTMEFIPTVIGDNGELANGYIVGNKMYIATQTKSVDTPISWVVGHEFLHRFKDVAPEQYAKFVASVKKFLGEEEWNRRMEAQKALYEKNNLHEKAANEALMTEECVADFMGEMVEEHDAFNNYLNSIKEENAILRGIKRVLKAISEFFNRKNKRINEMLEQVNALIAAAEKGEAKDTKSSEKEKTSLIGVKGVTSLENNMTSGARLRNLEIARQMEKQGKDALSIKQATNWERGVDGLWRYEMPDYIDNRIIDKLYEFGGDRVKGLKALYQEERKVLDAMYNNAFDLREVTRDNPHSTYSQRMRSIYNKYRDMSKMEQIEALNALSTKINALENGAPAFTLEELLGENHILFAAYPQMRKFNVVTYNYKRGDNLGKMIWSTQTIEMAINTGNTYGEANTLTHEIQHAIQSIEGFAEGGTPTGVNPYAVADKQSSIKEATEKLEAARAKKAELEARNMEIDKAIEAWEAENPQVEKFPEDINDMYWEGEDNKETLKTLARDIREYERDLHMANKMHITYGPTNYEKLAGEVEARTVAKRRMMTPEERRNSLAVNDSDIAPEDRILVRNGGMITPEMSSEEKRYSVMDAPVSAEELADIEAERKSIIETTKANGTYLKAPNGKNTNLSPEQWVNVRTSRFKKWFGDWEKAARIAKLRGSNNVIVPENVNEGKFELNRTSAEAYILNDLRKEYTIADTGEKVTITRKGAKKVTSHSTENIAHLKSIAAIPEMLNNAIFIEQVPADKAKAKYDAYRYYMCGLRIGNEDYTVRITIGVKSGKYYYDHSLTNIEKGNLIEIAQGFTPNGGRTLPSYTESKDTRILSILQTNSSKIVDENGEPKVVYHGTPNYFNAFSKEMFGTSTDRGIWGNGFYFSEDSGYAKQYQKRNGADGRTLSLFLSLKNPLFISLKDGGNEGAMYFHQLNEKYFTDDIFEDAAKTDAKMKAAQQKLSDNLIADGYDGVVIEYSHPTIAQEYVAFEPNQIKSAKENIGTYSEKSNDVRYSLSAPTFYSNAEYAVRNIKQEKATPEQWLKMIEKNGGLKAGEDKWLGLSDWLKASDKKTLTKDEVLQYIADNNFVIEEVEYGDVADISREEIYESSEFEALRESLTEYDDEDNPYISRERYDELRSESPDFVDGFSLDYWGEELEINSPAAAATYLGLTKADKEINSTRLVYTTAGLENKREIALVVPSIEPYNRHDEIHFGDAGDGRAVAWIRFGETEAPKNVPMHQRVEGFDEPFETATGLNFYAPKNGNGKFAKDYVLFGKLKDGSEGYIIYIDRKPISKHDTLEDARNAMNEYYEANPRMITRYERVLVIDEIQSKRHQDGREKGYKDEIIESYKRRGYKIRRNASDDGWLIYEGDKFLELVFDREGRGVPSAPFEKNWAELAMKRMLRYAAENGFDKVAWTTGEQQADRYNIGNVVSRVLSYPFEGKTKVVINLQNDSPMKMTVNSEGVVEKSNNGTEGQSLADVVGKELANKIMNGEGETATVYDGGDIEAKEISGDGLRIGGEGMKAFYDQMLPSFMNKYGKKWGVKVGEVTMPNLEENNTMHAVNVTDSMRESVMQGQPRYSLITPEMDADYLSAVERGDMATAQQMVLEAAKLAMPNTKVVDEDGNPKVVYHQTNATVYINRETGQNWDELDWRERMEWDERDDWDEYWEEREFNTFSRVNARTTNELDGFFFAPEYDEYHEYGDRTIEAFLNIENPASNGDYNIDASKTNAGRDERVRMQNEGYDGVINKEDGEIYEYVAFNPNQIKSADPVTYDDNGNVIPLSERFNPEEEDIRFSLQSFDDKVQFVSLITRELNIDVPLVIADTVDEYLNLLTDLGCEVQDDDAETTGMYFPIDDVICLNGAMLQNERDVHYAILHEYTHSIINKYLKDERKAISDSLKKEAIEAARKEMFGDKYENETAGTILEEFVCYLVEKLPNAKIKAIFTGKLSAGDYAKAIREDLEKSDEIVNREVLYAILPLLEKSIEKQKEQYEREKARNITIPRVSSFERVNSGAESWNDESVQGGTSRQTSGYGVRTEATQDERGETEEEAFGNGRGSKHLRPSTRGGLLDESRFSLVDMPFFEDNGDVVTFEAMTPEERKAAQYEEAVRMTEEGNDAQAILDATGWINTEDGWEYFGEADIALSGDRAELLRVGRWLQSKAAIKKNGIRNMYADLIKEQKAVLREREKQQREAYEAKGTNKQKVEFILQGQAPESLSFEDQVLVDIALGQRLKWNDGDGKRGLKTELGLENARAEKMGAVTIGAKDYIEDYVKALMERNNGYENDIDDNDIRNAVIEVFRSFPSPRKAVDELYARYRATSAVAEAEEGLYQLEVERDAVLAEIDADLRSTMASFEENPSPYIRDYNESESWQSELGLYTNSLRKAKETIERMTQGRAVDTASRKSKAEAVRTLKAFISNMLRGDLSRYTHKRDILALMNAVNESTTVYQMLRAINKAMESAYNVRLRKEVARMNNLSKMRIVLNETNLDPQTFLNNMVKSGKMTLGKARQVLNNYWRGVNASGVVIAQGVDADTANIMQFIHTNIDMANLNGKTINEKCKKLRDDIEVDKSISEDFKAKKLAAVDIIEEYLNLQQMMAALREINGGERPIEETIAHKATEIAKLNNELRTLESKGEALLKTDRGYKTRKKAIEDKLEALRNEYSAALVAQEQAYASYYGSMPDIIERLYQANNSLEGILKTGEIALSQWKQAEVDHRNELIRMALEDINRPEALVSDEIKYTVGQKLRNSAAGRIATAHLNSFDHMLRRVGEYSPNGEGKLWKYFTHKLLNAYNRLFDEQQACADMMNNKCRELFGKDFNKMMRKAENTVIGTIDKIQGKIDNTKKDLPKDRRVQVEVVKEEITIAQALNIIATWNQVDGRKSLLKQGFTDEKINALINTLDANNPKWIAFEEWVIHSFLPSRREKYNKVYRSMFGTDMDRELNYFPLRRDKTYIHNEVDLASANFEMMPSTITGSIIQRTKSTAKIDLKNSFFEVLRDHIVDMEKWAETAPIIKDLNTMLSSNPVQIAMKAKGEKFLDQFKEAAKVATLNFSGNTPEFEKVFAPLINRMWASSLLAFKPFTALKQLASSVLFAQYSADPRFLGRLAYYYAGGFAPLPDSVFLRIGEGKVEMPKQRGFHWNIQWALDNSAMFRERWESVAAGNDVFMKKLNYDTKLGKFVGKGIETLTMVGMVPIAFVDAYTSSAGMRAVYDYTYYNLRKKGATHEEAHAEAMFRAEMAVNKTQQSSQFLYLAPMQMDRGLISMVSTFQNAPYAQGRIIAESLTELVRNPREEKRAVVNEEMEWLKTHQFANAYAEVEAKIAEEKANDQITTPEQERERRAELQRPLNVSMRAIAEKKAPKIIAGHKVRAGLAFALNAYLAQFAFNAMAVLPYVFFGDDDEKKKELLKDVAKWSLLGPLSTIPVGNALVSAFQGFDFQPLGAYNDLMEDINLMVKEYKENGFEGDLALMAADFLARKGLGVDYKTYFNLYSGLQSLAKDGYSHEALLKALNAPNSQVRLLAGERREGETFEQYATRILRLYTIFGDDTVFEENYKDGKFTNGNKPVMMSKTQLRDMRKNYEQAFRNDILKRKGGYAKRDMVNAIEEEYAKVMDAMGWTADKNPNNKAYDTDTYVAPISGVNENEYYELAELARQVAADFKITSSYVGNDDDRYYQYLMREVESKKKLIDKFNNAIKSK